MDADLDRISSELAALVREKTGDPRPAIGPLTVLPGHAGLSYAFDLATASAAGPASRKLVIRLAPEGVPIAGPTDVVRQARVMASLAGTGVPVPPVLWFDNDPRYFGRPFFVVGFLEGDKLALGERTYNAEETALMTGEAMRALAALHRLEWEPRRAAWGEPVSLGDEMKRLDNLLDRPTLDPKVVGRAAELRERLRRTIPARTQVGFVHGDFQWSNCLFAGTKLRAVIDWELSQVGASLIDLGWLCVFSDRESWVGLEGDGLVPTHARPPEEMAAMYQEASQRTLGDAEVRWFRAFAGYRFGVITAFNLMLHRRGKRPDPMWEDIALSGPRLFERGLELLG
ncbi:MAG TPA: phosphotransferase family protein [Candidatus Binataceae bacterium]|nr:phosphotransferase family protein [Candidatus Binataceae bacterium]HVA68724.1 phosphotransferase family protein [Candidatus Binataceae bacterium]